jgi:hypothetical protein
MTRFDSLPTIAPGIWSAVLGDDAPPIHLEPDGKDAWWVRSPIWTVRVTREDAASPNTLARKMERLWNMTRPVDPVDTGWQGHRYRCCE